MNRNLLGTVISSILLFFAIIVWQDLFIFQKTTINYPAWAKALPYPMMAAHIIVVVTLMPLFFSLKANSLFIKSIFIVSIIAPLISIIVMASVNNTSLTLNNFTSDIIWVIGINCIPPTLLAIISRAIFDIFTNERANKAIKSDAKKRRALS